MSESWLPVVGYEGLYEVSDQGHVRSLDKMIPTWTGTLRLHKGRMLTPSPDTAGYFRVGLVDANGDKKAVKVHRIVAKSFVKGEWLTVNHVDGDKSNNAASNLEWCSQRDNNIHGIRSGLIAPTPGESNGNSKLTEDAVRYIRRLVKAGMKLAHVGNVFGIHSSYVRSIVNRTAWRHIA